MSNIKSSKKPKPCNIVLIGRRGKGHQYHITRLAEAVSFDKSKSSIFLLAVDYVKTGSPPRVGVIGHHEWLKFCFNYNFLKNIT